MSRSAQMQTLLDHHLAGVPGSTEALVTAMRPVILRRVLHVFKRRRTADHQRSPEILEEIVQEVYLNLFRHNSAALRAYTPGGCLTVVKYISRIACRQANNHLDTLWSQKRGGRTGSLSREAWSDDILETPADSYTPEAQIVARQATNRLGTLLFPALTRRGRVAFQAIFIDGGSVDEVALRLGSKRSHVHNWRHRIRREAERVAYQEGLFEPKGSVALQLAA